MLIVDIVALYLTSPADIADALLLRSATPFSIYGVVGFGGVLLIAALVLFRSKIPTGHWKTIHVIIALIVVLASVIHALWIQGTMGLVSMWLLCGVILLCTMYAVIKLKIPQVFIKKNN